MDEEVCMFEENKAAWLKKAEALKPILNRSVVSPIGGMPDHALSEGESVVLNFGAHFVGYVSLRLSFEGSHPDAPAWLRFKFCESPRELEETPDQYHGWISRSWIQQEEAHADVLPCELRLPRRYAFRYVRIEVLGLSAKYRLVLEDAHAETVTSADDGAVLPLQGEDWERDIDRTALATLRSCMQDVFEDGPKRDRRLWLGDLHLQALTDSVTYRRFDLEKRCLYLFAAAADESGRIPACLFTEPRVEGDDTFMFDYSLLFIPTLLHYARASGDEVTMRDLLPLALHQLALAEEQFDPETNLIRDCDRMGWCFVDWNLQLNKQTCAQSIWICCAEAALCMRDDPALRLRIAQRKAAMTANWYDKGRRLFVSGSTRQVSMASQIWAVLAGAVEGAEAAACLDAAAACPEALGIVTPYMMHYYVLALCRVGRREQALDVLRGYWGAMVRLGADTFWELFNPADPDESPYGSPIVNSYCHAWSCTPSWFLRSGILQDNGQGGTNK